MMQVCSLAIPSHDPIVLPLQEPSSVKGSKSVFHLEAVRMSELEFLKLTQPQLYINTCWHKSMHTGKTLQDLSLYGEVWHGLDYSARI